MATLDAIASCTKGNSFTRNEARFAYYLCNLFHLCCQSRPGAAIGKLETLLQSYMTVAEQHKFRKEGCSDVFQITRTETKSSCSP